MWSGPQLTHRQDLPALVTLILHPQAARGVVADLPAHSPVIVAFSYEFCWRVLEGRAVEVDVHGLLSLVYHLKEGLEHGVEVQGLIRRKGHQAADDAGLGKEEVRPPVGQAEGQEVVGVLGLPGEEPVLEELVHDAGCAAEAVLHDIHHVCLLPVVLQQGVDAVAVYPEVKG